MKRYGLIAIGSVIGMLVPAPSCIAQDLQTRVKQHQAEVRQKIEEGRTRILQHRQELERSHILYVYGKAKWVNSQEADKFLDLISYVAFCASCTGFAF